MWRCFLRVKQIVAPLKEDSMLCICQEVRNEEIIFSLMVYFRVKYSQVVHGRLCRSG